MNNESTLRRIAYEAATESVMDMIRIEEQAAALARLRDSENVVLPDDRLEAIAALPEDKFASAYDDVRTMYARRDRGATLSKALTSGPGAEFYTRVLDHAQVNGCSIEAAKAELLGGAPATPVEKPLPKLPPLLNNPYYQMLQRRIAMSRRAIHRMKQGWWRRIGSSRPVLVLRPGGGFTEASNLRQQQG